MIYVDHGVPVEGRSSGENRACAVVKALTALSDEIICLSLDSSDLGTSAEWAQARARASSRSATTVVWAVRPGAWVLARELLALASPNCVVVYDTVDDHRRRALTACSYGHNLSSQDSAGLLLEDEALRQTDVAVAVSAVEAQRFAMKTARAAVVGNPFTLEVEVPEPREPRIAFIGNFEHSPNVDAVQAFVGDCWPRLSTAIPGLRFMVGGRACHLLQTEAQAGVDIVGEVEDLRGFYARATLVVAPLRFGAGLKGKVSEAYAYGRSVVGTDVAFEGYRDVASWGVVAASCDSWLEAIARLLPDEPERTRLVNAGRTSLQNSMGGDLVAQVAAVLEQTAGIAMMRAS